jgi:hypothetical protein
MRVPVCRLEVTKEGSLYTVNPVTVLQLAAKPTGSSVYGCDLMTGQPPQVLTGVMKMGERTHAEVRAHCNTAQDVCLWCNIPGNSWVTRGDQPLYM